MEIFNGSFLESLKEKIAEIVSGVFEGMLEQEKAKVRYLTTEGVCNYVSGLDPSTLNRWVEMGLRKVKVVGVVRYDKNDIDEFMAKHKI